MCHNAAVRRLTLPILAVVVVVGALAVYRPALSFQLMGDDYQWWQHAHHAMHAPALLLADLDTFYRPASTWTLVADRLLWGHNATGYHLTNLLLQCLAGVLLGALALRLGLSGWASGAVATVWALAPFAEEPALSVAIRFENLLLIAWLTLLLAWPREDQRWSRGRVTTVVLATVMAAMSKETWVVTPILVVAAEMAFRRAPLRRAIRASLPFCTAAAAYTLVYFLAFPSDKSYFELSVHVLAKVPQEMAAFLALEPLAPAGFTLDARGVLATVVIAAAGVLVWRRRNRVGLLGLALLLAPTLPTLLVPFLPTRYTAVPYAGFVLLVVAVAQEAAGRLSPRVAAAGTVGLAALAAAILVAGAFVVRADLADFARVSAAHGQLLAEARRVVRSLPLDRPLAIVRVERANPLHDIAVSVVGWPKLFYVRHPDPSGLIDAAALFEWTLGREDIALERIADGEKRFAGRPGRIVLHTEQGFVVAPVDVADLGKELRHLREGGQLLRVIEARRL